MARDNYSYKKYQRELAKKKKNDEKRQRKLDKKNIEAKAPPALSDGGHADSAADSGEALNEDVSAV